MAVLVDASVLVRVFDRRSADAPMCDAAMQRMRARRGEFLICAQTAIEFWVVATRPLDVNGLGLTPADADMALTDFERFLVMLSEPADVAVHWRDLVRTYGVAGRPAHDARLVALMRAYGLTDILTLNSRDFRRYPFVRIFSPEDVVAAKV